MVNEWYTDGTEITEEHRKYFKNVTSQPNPHPSTTLDESHFESQYSSRSAQDASVSNINRKKLYMDEIFYTILFLGVVAFVYGFLFVKVYSAKHDEKAQNFWGWISMLLTTVILLVLFSVWSLNEPLAKGFFPAFLVISLVGGLLARESLISPYRLARFWGKLASKRKKNRGQHVSD